ncbi:unnamed protein product [Bemisia tabaci]|uniref:Uncharacterized protein n=1 Tax=Bemisia tabaci TaxID=7038 RepID=A0A9P0A6E5_BEMTA|nr:unnamed protein product [Bemisia tabaci]
MVEELKRWEQEKYKEELDEQIREKERLRREAEEAEQREEEERDRIFREQTRKLQEEYERELNSRRFFVWQRRKRAEVLKKRLEQLEREDEERRRLKRLERQRRGRRAVLSQGNIFTDDVTFTDRLKARSLSPSLLSYPIPRNLYPHKTDPVYHRFTPPITPKPWLRGGPDTLIIDAPHDLSVKPKVGIAPLLVDPNAVPLPLPKVHHRSRRLQEPDSAKSYKLVGESNSPYGFHRSKRILTQLGQFRKQLQFGNKLRNF